MAVVRGTTTSRSVSAVQRPARGRGSLREIDRYGGKYGSLLGAENKRGPPVGSCEPQALRWRPGGDLCGLRVIRLTSVYPAQIDHGVAH